MKIIHEQLNRNRIALSLEYSVGYLVKNIYYSDSTEFGIHFTVKHSTLDHIDGNSED